MWIDENKMNISGDMILIVKYLIISWLKDVRIIMVVNEMKWDRKI